MERGRQDFLDSAVTELTAAVADAAGSSPYGTDLAGALQAALRATAEDDIDHIVLVLGNGGVSRSASGIDLVSPPVSPATADAVAASVELPVPEDGKRLDVHVTILGVGRFDGDTHPPEPTFTNGVTAFWRSLCDRITAEVTDGRCEVPT